MYFTFDHPQYLWYLLSIPLLVVSHFAFLKYTKRRAMKFANFQALRKVSDQNIFTKNHIVLVIRTLILISIIFAITGTTLWYMGLSTQNTVVLAIDTSASMTAQDIYPSRLEAAKSFAKTITDKIGADSKIGVISFAGGAFITILPTDNKAEVKAAISDIQSSHEGGTNIPDAIITSTNLLLESKTGRTVIMLSDGSNTVSYFNADPIKQGVKYAQDNNVVVYTIGLGNDTAPIGYLPEYYNISAVTDTETLYLLANQTGGVYYAANTTDALMSDFDSLVFNAKESYIGKDMTMGLMIFAMLLIFLEWGLISTRFRAIP